MDIAYNQHSPHSRRHNHSSTSLNHLTLAPLTSRLPPANDDYVPTSYIESPSLPTTPSVLSRSTSRVSLRKPAPTSISIPKSKSSTHLGPSHRSGTTTPSRHSHLRNATTRGDFDVSTFSEKDRNDSDWLLRAGAMISTSTRESKGQSWLASRASSTSLQRDQEEEAFERELAREREQASRKGSRRGSAAGAFDADDEFSPLTTRRSLSFGPMAGGVSRSMSRYGSRANSRRGSRATLITPLPGERDGYFDRDFVQEEYPAEPDFVDVEEEGYDVEDADQARNDEAVVQKLARASRLGLGGWVEKMLGWSLFAVEEDGEETEVDTMDEKEGSEISSRPSQRDLHIDGLEDSLVEEMPPLNPNEADGWHDAAWLLSVASRVLL
ncbi:DUF3984 domain protein [Rutstroemia sp. NJR-2017a BBW]|nr:DUF3984 domain protein [Rutstroemia sp. NJR-2017a BBW]